MARRLLIYGRLLFLNLFITQCFFLVEYVVKYEGKGDIVYWLLVLLFLPGFIAWLVVINDGRIRWLWCVWLLYTWFALTPMIGFIFRSIVIEDKLSSAVVFGPNVLKAILCITPALLLLLLQSTTERSEYDNYRELLNDLSFTTTFDLFDGIEMLGIILDEDENPYAYEVPKELEITIVVFVCVFFFLSPLELFRFKFSEVDELGSRKTALCIRRLVQALLNLSFLVFRLILWFKYGRNAPIFIAKNGISVILLFLRLYLRVEY